MSHPLTWRRLGLWITLEIEYIPWGYFVKPLITFPKCLWLKPSESRSEPNVHVERERESREQSFSSQEGARDSHLLNKMCMSALPCGLMKLQLADREVVEFCQTKYNVQTSTLQSLEEAVSELRVWWEQIKSKAQELLGRMWIRRWGGVQT